MARSPGMGESGVSPFHASSRTRLDLFQQAAGTVRQLSAHRVAAGAFCAVQRGVGSTDQFIQGAVLGESGHTQ